MKRSPNELRVEDTFLLRNKDDSKMRAVRPPKIFKLLDGSLYTSYDAAYRVSLLIMKPMRPQRGNLSTLPIPHVVLQRIKGIGPETRSVPFTSLWRRDVAVSITNELDVG